MVVFEEKTRDALVPDFLPSLRCTPSWHRRSVPDLSRPGRSAPVLEDLNPAGTRA